MTEQDLIQREIQGNHIVVFMKGTVEKPQCCFSAQTVRQIKEKGLTYKSVDVLQHKEMYDALRRYTNYTHFPQVFVDGKFVGTKL